MVAEEGLVDAEPDRRRVGGIGQERDAGGVVLEPREVGRDEHLAAAGEGLADGGLEAVLVGGVDAHADRDEVPPLPYRRHRRRLIDLGQVDVADEHGVEGGLRPHHVGLGDGRLELGYLDGQVVADRRVDGRPEADGDLLLHGAGEIRPHVKAARGRRDEGADDVEFVPAVFQGCHGLGRGPGGLDELGSGGQRLQFLVDGGRYAAAEDQVRILAPERGCTTGQGQHGRRQRQGGDASTKAHAVSVPPTDR